MMSKVALFAIMMAMRFLFILAVLFSFSFAQDSLDPNQNLDPNLDSSISGDATVVADPNVDPGVYKIGKITSIDGETAFVEIAGKSVKADLPIDDPNGIKAPVFREGQRVVLYQADGKSYIAEAYRVPVLAWLLGLFVLAVVTLGRGKGVRGLIGTATSLLVLIKFIVPQISAGADPLQTTFVGAFGILAVSIYFVHGVTKKTTAALIGTTLATIVALVLGVTITELAKFTGLSSEEIFLAQFEIGKLDLIALYMASVVVGALGALNDVTVTQASVVQALHQANPRYTLKDLYSRGMAVGFDHIGSLVNTLVLAYVAGSLPLLLLLSRSNIPLMILLNQEAFSAQLVSILIGSLALVLAVPLTTVVASWLLRGKKLDFIDRRWPRNPG